MSFAVGDKVVYPHHGAAIIEAKEKRPFDGKKTDYFVLRITYGDLKVSIPVDKADFQLKISAPGEVLDTNGDTDSGTISWNFTPGQVGDIRASLAYDDPNAPSATAWTLGLSFLVAAVALGVVLVARRTRNEPLTPAGR